MVGGADVYERVCPVLDIVSEFEATYAKNVESSSISDVNPIGTAVEEIKNRTCNWVR